MPLWGLSDAASNSTLFALDQVGVTANTANRTALFGNTTADAFITGVTVGQFGSDANEVRTERLDGGPTRSPGWNLRTTKGSRVMNETLVAMSHRSLITDASDDTTLPDYFTLNITTQPSNASANTSAAESALFTVVASSTPPGATLAYNWQANSGAGFAAVSNGAVYSGQSTASLSVDDPTGLNGVQYRVIISSASTGVANVTSSTATLTVTS
jgi:hypothetical protein